MKRKAIAITEGPVTLPVNVGACQVEIRTEPSAAETVFRFGPPPRPEPCGMLVSWIGMANGGAMGLCQRHKEMGEREIKGFTAQPVARKP